MLPFTVFSPILFRPPPISAAESHHNWSVVVSLNLSVQLRWQCNAGWFSYFLFLGRERSTLKTQPCGIGLRQLTGPWYTNTARQRQLVICLSKDIICICIFSLIPTWQTKLIWYRSSTTIQHGVGKLGSRFNSQISVEGYNWKCTTY